MNILKSLFFIVGFLTLASLTTNAYYASQATVTANQFSTGDSSGQGDKITICHFTGPNGDYQSINIDKAGAVDGHAGGSHQDGKDIMPPFDYGNPAQHFSGQNWDSEGQTIYNNNCQAVAD